ncbi:hypothetical protein [Curtobacterium sp. PhB78]|uniref:hypothetical protein n=1 Tax=Curtobacterium sp. PhB78 TaxID=2485102 RepID=UPI000F4705F3|nr:hypothetical protein [Curtobacterium sp. PhB78]ROS46169.1 hypothetical protein EDF53_0987 [Curtobacterium sp. PhB78]
MDSVLLAATSTSSSHPSPGDGTSWTDTGGFIVALISLVLSIVVAVVGWVQIKSAKTDARAANEQANAAKSQAESAKSFAESAHKQTAIAEKAAESARKQASAAIAALEWETLPQLEVIAGPREELLDYTVDPPVPAETSTWRVRNIGKAEAIRLTVAMDFDPSGSIHGAQTIPQLSPGRNMLLQAYIGLFPSFEQASHDGAPPEVFLTYTTPTGEVRHETKRVIRYDPHA